MIGLDDHNRLFYEGSSFYGHGLWPSPFISTASIISGPDDWKNVPQSQLLDHAKLVFREDSFDPVTRIRRGRIYRNHDSNPEYWHVQTHPAYKEEVGEKDNQGRLRKRLFTFDPWIADQEFKDRMQSVIIALGIQGAITCWNVLGIERISTREDLITLRARSAFGVIPELKTDSSLNEQEYKDVSSSLNNLAHAAFRAGPESVIDRCRDIVQLGLSIWMAGKFKDQSLRGQEIGHLIRKLESQTNERPTIVISIAKTIARLHARAKPNEQFKNEYRLPTESDAECAITLVGLLMRELNWSAN